jgi:hypothetical protein
LDPSSNTLTVSDYSRLFGIPLMTLRVLVLLFLSLPPWHGDRKEPNRSDRIQTIALSTERATVQATCDLGDDECRPIWPDDRGSDLEILLAVVAWHETRLARHVHENRCRRWECGAYVRRGEVYFRSRGVWQIEESPLTSAEWHRIRGADQASTDAAAWAAAKALSHGLRRCGTLRGALSLYATGKRCSWSGADARMVTYKKLQKRAAKIGRDE